MKTLRLIILVGVCFLGIHSLQAQVKIGDNPLLIDTTRWLEIEEDGEFLIVNDSLYFGMSNNRTGSNNRSLDALKIKLFGYGLNLSSFAPTNPDVQAFTTAGSQRRNIFLAPARNTGELLEVPMGLSLVVQDSTTADLGITNGQDTFGIADLMALDSIFATDISLRDSINNIRVFVNNSNDADQDTVTGNEYIDTITVVGDTALQFVENNGAIQGPTNTTFVDLSPIIGANTFYLSDGTLDEDRTVTGDGHSLTFNGLDSFTLNATTGHTTINSNEISIQQGGMDVIMVNNAQDVKFRSTTTDSIVLLNNNGDIVFGNYGDSSNTGTVTTLLAVDADGNVIEIGPNDILAYQIDSTIYNSDGILTSNRTLDGAGLNLTFQNLGALTDSSATSLSTTTGSNTVESTAGDVTINANGTIDMNADSVHLGGVVKGDNFGVDDMVSYATIIGATAEGVLVDVDLGDITENIYTDNGTLAGDRTVDGASNSLYFNSIDSFAVNANSADITADVTTVSDSLVFSNYGDSMITGNVNTLLAVDTDGNVIEIGPNDILAYQIDSTIYNSDGTLTENRTLDGAGLNLTFQNLGALTDSSATSLSTTTGSNTVESTSGDVTLNANGTTDINAPFVNISDTLILEGYGDTSIIGTLSTILATDINGRVIEVGADAILNQQEDSTIYTHDGTLTDERFMTMDTRTLHFLGDNGDTTVIDENGRMAIGRGTVTSHLMSGRNIMLDVNGDIYAQQVHSSSDRRFKKNIKVVDNALEKVLQIEGVTYDWRRDEFPGRNFSEAEQLGFIAQNIEKVAPQVVMTAADGYKAVDYAKVTALLTEAIKEQQKVIESLQTELSVAKTDKDKLATEIADIRAMISSFMTKTESSSTTEEE